MKRATRPRPAQQSHRPVSIHALNEESDKAKTRRREIQDVSIHALNEESDRLMALEAALSKVSIHALNEESDKTRDIVERTIIEFQSTLSMKRATIKAQRRKDKVVVSIHALNEESDEAWRVIAH